MTTFSIQNFGCRATDADAASVRHQLLSRGLTLIDEHSDAEVVVLNTCTVTAAADAQARETVRKIHRANPAARIMVTGCYAQRAPEELAAMPGVAWVVGNSHQQEIANVVVDFGGRGPVEGTAGRRGDLIPLAGIQSEAMSLARGPAKILTGDIFAQGSMFTAPAALVAGDRTRPILKIQDGCDNRCSYCVIPFVRGNSRSLAPDAVIEQVRALTAAGAKEIVLSGINLGSYGRDLSPRAEVRTVVHRILDETELDQLRFSSIEPQDITEEFVALAASPDSAGRIAPHFHVPLQSGSNRILRAMRRWYRAEHYAERIKLIRAALPDAGIGADVIVGFPGELDEDFAATVELIERLPFTYLHVFSFSPRPGTEAAKCGGSVPSGAIRERARALRSLSERKASEFRTSRSGSRIRALTLNRSGENYTEALTGNYLKVRIPGLLSANQWYDVPLTASAAEVGVTASPR